MNIGYHIAAKLPLSAAATHWPAAITWLRTAFAACLLLTLTACERPFVEPSRPDIEIVSPDLTSVFPSNKIQLQVTVRAFREVENVVVNGDTLIYDPDAQLWEGDIGLREGLNRLIFSVTDTDDLTSHDTAFAVHAGLNIDRNAPQLLEPRGAHTATMVSDGRVILIGGAHHDRSDALASAASWRVGDQEFLPLTTGLQAPRAGHTATLLPDGRILVIGGSATAAPQEVFEMVEVVEIFDPTANTFSVVPLDGDPIRRAYHTASLHRDGSRIFVDLYGGLGDVRYRPESAFGTRRDIRRFEFRSDSLIAINRAPGPQLEYAVWGHSQTQLDSPDLEEEARHLVVGAAYGENFSENISFVLDYGSSAGIDRQPAGEPTNIRTRHASARLGSFVAIFGGHQETPASALNAAELYSHEANRFFIFPPASVLLRRYAFTATNLSSDRILLLGGFFSSGQGAVASTVVRVPAL